MKTKSEIKYKAEFAFEQGKRIKNEGVCLYAKEVLSMLKNKKSIHDLIRSEAYQCVLRVCK
jgi:hypothetical protein